MNEFPSQNDYFIASSTGMTTVSLRLFLDALDILRFRSSQLIVRLCLRWIAHVRRIQQLLHSNQNLLDGDGRFPPLLFVQNAQAHLAGWIHVWMKESSRKRHPRRSRRVIVSKLQPERIQPASPGRVGLPRDLTVPHPQIRRHVTFGVPSRRWLRDETVRVIFAPVLALLRQSGRDQR